MQKKLRKKISFLDFVLFSTGITAITFSVILFFYSLTFLIRNINLILKTPAEPTDIIHFNLESAKKLFPSG